MSSAGGDGRVGSGSKVVGTALVLNDWRRLAVAAPQKWDRIFGVLTHRTEETPTFSVILN